MINFLRCSILGLVSSSPCPSSICGACFSGRVWWLDPTPGKSKQSELLCLSCWRTRTGYAAIAGSLMYGFWASSAFCVWETVWLLVVFLPDGAALRVHSHMSDFTWWKQWGLQWETHLFTLFISLFFPRISSYFNILLTLLTELVSVSWLFFKSLLLFFPFSGRFSSNFQPISTI